MYVIQLGHETAYCRDVDEAAATLAAEYWGQHRQFRVWLSNGGPPTPAAHGDWQEIVAQAAALIAERRDPTATCLISSGRLRYHRSLDPLLDEDGCQLAAAVARRLDCSLYVLADHLT